MNKAIAALAAVAAVGGTAAVPATASASTRTCGLYGLPIVNIHTNVGCGTADTIAQVENHGLRHWVAPHPGPAWYVTWRSKPLGYMSSRVFTARHGSAWATFQIWFPPHGTTQW
jgi:hypothetical protein